jgi:8-amino-3,8-dideoxy-alpha-D-manno-octulosonate transaminase
LVLNAHVARKGLSQLRRRARWLVRHPRVEAPSGWNFPGALRLGELEEEAAVEAVRDVMRSKRLFRYYGLSPNPLQRSRVRQLEREFVSLTGAGDALAVNSGTSALVSALAGFGVGPGDEVIVPAYTWFSSATAVLAVGAVPVIAEVDDSLTLDPEDFRAKLTPHTAAAIPVHMRGAPAQMDELAKVAAQKGVRLLEDVAQAAGASFRGRRLGSLGDAGAFSFQMAKLITAGEGGMLTSSDAEVIRRARMYHDAGVGRQGDISAEEWLPGLSLRMSELHAAVLLVQLERLDGVLDAMRRRKRDLKERLRGEFDARGIRFRTIHDADGEAGLALVFFLPDTEHIDRVVSGLADENVPASRLFHGLKHVPRDSVDMHVYWGWPPLIQKRTWSARGGPWAGHDGEVEYPEDACPRTRDLLERAIHIDIRPDLEEQHVEQLAGAITEVLRRCC